MHGRVILVANDFRLKRNLRGLNKLMTGTAATAEAMRAAHHIRRAAGPKYEVVASPHKWTAGAVVRPRDGEHIGDADRMALLRAVASARDVS